MKKTRSSNSIVNEIAKMNITGNIVPATWYQTIVKPNGTPHYLAILILAEIVYWYRPAKEKDGTSHTTKICRKFDAPDYLQKSYKELCEKFNCSQKQAREALKTLESFGLVKRIFRTITVNHIVCNNVMYLSLIPEELNKLTYPNTEPSSPDNKCSPKGEPLLPSSETPHSTNDKTNTKTTSQIKNIDNTTTPSVSKDAVVAETKEMLSKYNLDSKDIEAILRTVNYDIAALTPYVELLDKQPSAIQNVPGWLISAIKNNFHLAPHTPPYTCNAFKSQQYIEHSDVSYTNLEPLLLDN